MTIPTPADTAALIAGLKRILGVERVLAADDDRRFFSQDIAGPRAHVAACVAQPQTVEELAAVVAATAASGHIVVPRGGGSSYTGGYVPPRDECVLIDTRGLARVVEINTADMYVTVEVGCTWQALLAALEPHGVRTPFWGPLSGATATVGGSLSQNSILWGSARYGVSAESVLALEIVLADGSLLRTGAAAGINARPFFRYYGPDLTGLFLGDTGALGIKARATLRLIRRPAWVETASFGFGTHEQMAAAMTEIAREGLVSECFAMDPVLTAQRLKRAGLAQDLKAVKGVITSARGLASGLKEAARIALAGRSFLDAAPYSMHVGTEGRTQTAVTEALAEVRRIVTAQGGNEVENTVPKVLRGMPFVPMTSAIGPSGERWLPVHALVPLSDAATAWSAVRALFESRRADLDRLGVQIGVLTAIVGSNAFVLEPVFYWPAPRTLYYQRVLDDATRAKFEDFPPHPEAEALVFELRGQLTQLFLGRGAAHLQIGRTYRYHEGLRAEPARLLEAIKRAVDPDGVVNPGSLGLN
ncbi:MAG: FAD-binding oxidoreductase [Steroidobacteraceae bacterium]|nr:FAD-binding oxidoreductase [Steroidobacteraceae bacterium]